MRTVERWLAASSRASLTAEAASAAEEKRRCEDAARQAGWASCVRAFGARMNATARLVDTRTAALNQHVDMLRTYMLDELDTKRLGRAGSGNDVIHDRLAWAASKYKPMLTLRDEWVATTKPWRSWQLQYRTQERCFHGWRSRHCRAFPSPQ